MDYDKEKALEWINTYWQPPRSCPVCGDSAWVLMERVWELREFRGGTLTAGPGHPVLPMIAVMCNVCGHTVLFNAIAARAVERPTRQEGDNV